MKTSQDIRKLAKSIDSDLKNVYKVRQKIDNAITPILKGLGALEGIQKELKGMDEDEAAAKLGYVIGIIGGILGQSEYHVPEQLVDFSISDVL